jgi:hypothetical protein
MAAEKCRDAINDSGGVDAGTMRSDRVWVSSASCDARVTTRHDTTRHGAVGWGGDYVEYSHLTLELLHDIQEAIVYVRLVHELDLRADTVSEVC